jgi:hypothetical protein
MHQQDWYQRQSMTSETDQIAAGHVRVRWMQIRWGVTAEMCGQGCEFRCTHTIVAYVR